MIELVFKHFDDILIAIILTIYFSLFMPTWVGLWIFFEKMEYHGIWSFIPFINIVILISIAKIKWHWVFFLLFPIVGYLIVFWRIWRSVGLQLGYSKFFTLGLVLLPLFFIPFLGAIKKNSIAIDTNL